MGSMCWEKVKVSDSDEVMDMEKTELMEYIFLHNSTSEFSYLMISSLSHELVWQTHNIIFS